MYKLCELLLYSVQLSAVNINFYVRLVLRKFEINLPKVFLMYFYLNDSEL